MDNLGFGCDQMASDDRESTKQQFLRKHKSMITLPSIFFSVFFMFFSFCITAAPVLALLSRLQHRTPFAPLADPQGPYFFNYIARLVFNTRVNVV